MKRLSLILLGGIALAIAAACGGGAPPQPVTPQPNADSIPALERARQDSIDPAAAEGRAREEAEPGAPPRAAHSPAAAGRTAEAVRTMLAAMAHFGHDTW